MQHAVSALYCRAKDHWQDGTTLPQPTTRQAYIKDLAGSVNAPAWDVMENRVLKFCGYFKEHVDESREGNNRTRPCEILYYLEVGLYFCRKTLHSTAPESG